MLLPIGTLLVIVYLKHSANKRQVISSPRAPSILKISNTIASDAASNISPSHRHAWKYFINSALQYWEKERKKKKWIERGQEEGGREGGEGRLWQLGCVPLKSSFNQGVSLELAWACTKVKVTQKTTLSKRPDFTNCQIVAQCANHARFLRHDSVQKSVMGRHTEKTRGIYFQYTLENLLVRRFGTQNKSTAPSIKYSHNGSLIVHKAGYSFDLDKFAVFKTALIIPEKYATCPTSVAKIEWLSKKPPKKMKTSINRKRWCAPWNRQFSFQILLAFLMVV